MVWSRMIGAAEETPNRSAQCNIKNQCRIFKWWLSRCHGQVTWFSRPRTETWSVLGSVWGVSRLLILSNKLAVYVTSIFNLIFTTFLSNQKNHLLPGGPTAVTCAMILYKIKITKQILAKLHGNSMQHQSKWIFIALLPTWQRRCQGRNQVPTNTWYWQKMEDTKISSDENAPQAGVLNIP